jgi:kynurenine formamidase
VRKLVDLSMPVHADMLTFPRVPPPALCVYETHEEFAERIGAAQYGVTSLTASNLVVVNDHVGTHCDARRHIVPDAGGADTIPLEWCVSDGVLLDFTGAEKGHGISASEVEAELDRIRY